MSRPALAPELTPDHSATSIGLSPGEINQLSQILVRLGVFRRFEDSGIPPVIMHETVGTAIITPITKAQSIYKLRQRKTRFFPKSTFGETAWEILLVLYIHDGLTRLCIRDIGQLIDIPATTLLRWLKVLEEERLITVRKHHLDRRISILDLTDDGRSKFSAFLADIPA